MEKQIFEIPWRALWRILFFVILVAVAYLAREIILGLFFAIVISAGLEIVVDFLERRGLSRILGTILVFLAIFLIIALVLYLMIPIIFVQLNSFFSSIKQLGGILKISNPQLQKSFDSLIVQVVNWPFSSGFSLAFDSLPRLFGGLTLAIFIFFSSFYLTLSRDGVEKLIRAILPFRYEEPALKFYNRVRRKLGAWLQLQIILSIVIGFLTAISLWLLGVKYAFFLGLMAAVFEIIPFVGPILTGAIAVLVAFSDSFFLAIITLIVFLAIQELESHVLVPITVKHTIGVHPVVVLASLLIGFEVAGFIGLVIAVPAATVFQEIIEEAGRRKPQTEES